MQGYLREIVKAAKQGVRVQGYFAWSLIDNFEWLVFWSLLTYISIVEALQQSPLVALGPFLNELFECCLVQGGWVCKEVWDCLCRL